MEYQVGFSGEQFSSNLLSGWDHHALEKVKLKKKKKNAIFPTHRKMPEMAQNWFPGKCS